MIFQNENNCKPTWIWLGQFSSYKHYFSCYYTTLVELDHHRGWWTSKQSAPVDSERLALDKCWRMVCIAARLWHLCGHSFWVHTLHRTPRAHGRRANRWANQSLAATKRFPTFDHKWWAKGAFLQAKPEWTDKLENSNKTHQKLHLFESKLDEC